MLKPSSSGVGSDLSSPGADRRIWVRYPSRRATYCRAANGDDPFCPAQACDISLGGIKLLSAHKFERGTMLTIGRLDSGAEKRGLLSAEVRYAVPTSEGKWIIGCAFQEHLREEELLTWLQEQE